MFDNIKKNVLVEEDYLSKLDLMSNPFDLFNKIC